MITIDFETKSYADLKKVGAWAYSEDLTTDIICVCWGIDSEPIQEWWPGKEDGYDLVPPDLGQALLAGHEVEAHNVAFERSIWINVLARKYGWPVPDDDKWRDTMAVACYYGLPAALDKLAHALRFEQKDRAGVRLISTYSKLYLKTAKTVIPDDDFDRFVEYCRHDVALEQSISDYLGDLPERELPIFLLDQKINMRGMHLDREGIAVATRIVEQRSDKLAEEFRGLTGFNHGQRKPVMGWFKDQGFELENMQAAYLQEILDEGEIPSNSCRRAVEIRLDINKASTKKLAAMERQCGSDGRARFQTRYHGAGTGRTTGSGFQPLNLNRGFEDVEPEQLVRDVMYGDAEWLDTVYGDAMDAVAKASRHWITAAPGHKIIAGDFTSIEAIILACLAGEQWKVEAFHRGEPIYERTADKIYKLLPGTVTKATHPAERFVGKTCELMCGYQGALGAWLKFDSSGLHSDEEILGYVKAWRAEHPAIVEFWARLQQAAISAVRHPDHIQGTGDIKFEMVDEWLTMILPNGKRIWYYKPQLEMKMPQWHQPTLKDKCRIGSCDCRERIVLTYMATKTGQFHRVHTYGGKLAENATQATSREVLMPAVQRIEDAGYPVVLTVYDEIVCEVPEGFGSPEELAEIMQQPAGDWMSDWPIKVIPWEGARYKK
jgi:DNA polymerase